MTDDSEKVARATVCGATTALLSFAIVFVVAGAAPSRADAPADTDRSPKFNATAYTVGGKTASGDKAKPGVVAADPKVLPLGSRIRVKDGGELSGEYVVKDKGRKIKGHKIDVYVHGEKRAKDIGKKPVHVDVLQYGDGSRQSARNEPVPPLDHRARAAK